MKLWLNPKKTTSYVVDPSNGCYLGMGDVAAPLALLQHCPVHTETAMHSLAGQAEILNLDTVWIKDESTRMGLGSFKALGGAYAVFNLAVEHLNALTGVAVNASDLTADESRQNLSELTVVCATAGNHGISVSSAARILGMGCEVFISESVPSEFEHRLIAQNAKVTRVGADYDQSFTAAKALCSQTGHKLVSDTSWGSYTQIPLDIMRGYLVMADEAAMQCQNDQGPPTHIFLQAAVGGLAGAVAAYFADRYGNQSIKSIVVEPHGADCLLKSVQAGEPTLIKGDKTVMGRLDCVYPSLVGYEILKNTAHAFCSISDEQSFEAMRRAHASGLNVGESGAAGFGALIAACEDETMRDQLGLDERSRVLLIASEGPADLALFETVTGEKLTA
ncbi:MAG: diaminopropionate ammonia-lyase [Saprospiraceae bacterium]